MRNEKIMKRDPAMDIIRCVACFGVVSVHFLLYPVLNARVGSIDERLWYYFLIVPAFLLVQRWCLI